ncbi:MAG TPA: hypothetical protein VLV16_09560 [Gemmatimonadales bacterium]|nr:hypothetical protein [Gemmatimonadales bacterium]
MRIRQTAIALAALLAACTPLRPQVELATGVSLKDYNVFEVAPVVDASGYTLFPWPIEDSLRLRLVDQLEHNKLTVHTPDADSANPAGVLVLHGTLMSFRSGSYNLREPQTRIASRCVFVAYLVDKETGRQVGRIQSGEDEVYMPFQVLMQCARLVADEVARQHKG